MSGADKGFKPYLLNRLDRETSGIILFGKFPRDREKLEAIFKDPLKMEFEDCCQICPIKPKMYLKAKRETNLKKILKNGPFKLDKDECPLTREQALEVIHKMFAFFNRVRSESGDRVPIEKGKRKWMNAFLDDDCNVKTTGEIYDEFLIYKQNKI